MKLYADLPARRLGQVVADLLMIAWVFLWARVGRAVHNSTLELAEPGHRLESAGSGFRDKLTTAGNTVDDLPVLDDKVATPFRDAAGAGTTIEEAGRDLVSAVESLATTLGWVTALTPILMLGGTYLCYEGAEKVWEKVAHHESHDDAAQAPPDEKTLISGAVRTDLILSGEIMVISLNEVADQGFWSRLAILAVVALVMTVLVYGAVGFIVKMDDVGLRLAEGPGKAIPAFGRGLVKAMPKLLGVLTIVGTAAMLWVGGHILLVGTDDLGLHFLYDFVHHIEEAAHDATGAAGGVVGWLLNTFASAVLGLIVGAILVAVVTPILRARKAKSGNTAHH